MKTRSECKALAVKEFEQLLTDCGWVDSYGKSARKIERETAPMFTRAMVSQALSAKPVYLVYTVTDDIKTGGYADNIACSGRIYIDYTITTQDPYYFDESENIRFLIDIELKGEARGWSINWQNELTVPALEVAAAAQYQTNYTATKRFNNLER